MLEVFKMNWTIMIIFSIRDFISYMDALFSAQVEVIMINLHNSSIGLFSSHWMKWFENGDVTYRVHQSELAIGIYQQL